jgi:hypothetical protein
MSDVEFLQAEIQRLSAVVGEYERMYLRAMEACRGHQRGLERALRKVARLESEQRLEYASKNAQLGRLWNENASLKNKVERLSLRLIAGWNEDQQQ